MAQILQGKGSIVLIVLGGQQNIEERLRGVTDALKKFPDIKVVQTIDDSGDPRVANDSTSNLLHTKTKVDGILFLKLPVEKAPQKPCTARTWMEKSRLSRLIKTPKHWNGLNVA